MAPTTVMLLTVKIAVGQRVEGQDFLRGAVAADLIDGGSEDEVLAIGNAGSGECFLVSLQAIAPGGCVVGVGEVGDVAVADRDKMLDQAAGTRWRCR